MLLTSQLLSQSSPRPLWSTYLMYFLPLPSIYHHNQRDIRRMSFRILLQSFTSDIVLRILIEFPFEDTLGPASDFPNSRSFILIYLVHIPSTPLLLTSSLLER